MGKIRSHHYVSWQLPVEDHIFLEGLMVRLKELERKVITLFFYEDLSQSDIARSMNISCNYVGYLLKNGLRKLRSHIEADELRDAQLRVDYAPTMLPAGGGPVCGAASVIDAASGLYHADYFRDRLAEEIARACRYRRSLALVVFTLGPERPRGEAGAPDALLPVSALQPTAVPRRRGRPPKRQPSPVTTEAGFAVRVAPDPQTAAQAAAARLSADAWQEIGTALRECLRKADVPSRWDDRTLAVALPHTGAAAAKAAERMTELLSRVSNRALTAGLALYPEDGREPAALIETALRRARAADEDGVAIESVPMSDLPAEPHLACPLTSCA
jgi:GGDEF domain-containing protein